MHVAVAMVGLPVEVMQQRDLAQWTLNQLRDWLINTHKFVVNGEIISVTFTAVKVVAQPARGYFAWALDASEQWRRSRDILQSPVTVVDGGYNTIDLYTLRDGNIDPRYVGGKKIGMRRVGELLRSSIQSAYGVDTSLFEADELVRALLAGQTPHIYYTNGEADVSALARQAVLFS